MLFHSKEVKHIVTPVIHCATAVQTRRNIRKAIEAGADGVWLINMHISKEELADIFVRMRAHYPDFWMGVNSLSKYPFQILEELSLHNVKADGVWVDNARVEENRAVQAYPEFLLEEFARVGFEGLYFGGVAFKYQAPVVDLEKVTKLAMKYMDVVTTSGDATGIAADVEKVIAMRAALGEDKPLALASGITPDNISTYLPYVNCFLVATGISSSFEELDLDLMTQLIQIVKNYKD